MCRKMHYSSAELMEQLREVIAIQAKSPENALHVTYRDSLPSSLVRDFLERIEDAHERELKTVAKNGFEDGYFSALRDNKIEFVSIDVIIQEMKYEPRFDEVDDVG